jgi:hypothetical protein
MKKEVYKSEDIEILMFLYKRRKGDWATHTDLKVLIGHQEKVRRALERIKNFYTKENNSRNPKYKLNHKKEKEIEKLIDNNLKIFDSEIADKYIKKKNENKKRKEHWVTIKACIFLGLLFVGVFSMYAFLTPSKQEFYIPGGNKPAEMIFGISIIIVLILYGWIFGMLLKRKFKNSKNEESRG